MQLGSNVMTVSPPRRNPVSWVDIYGADRVSMGVFIRVGFRMVCIHRWPWNPQMRDGCTLYALSWKSRLSYRVTRNIYCLSTIYSSKDIACPCIKSRYGKRRQIGSKTNTLSRCTTKILFSENCV